SSSSFGSWQKKARRAALVRCIFRVVAIGTFRTLSLSATLLSISLPARGGSQKDREAGGSAAPAEAPPEEDISEEEAALLAQIEESAAIADSEAAQAAGEPEEPANPEDGPPEREVVYRLSESGLKVQIEGAE